MLVNKFLTCQINYIFSQSRKLFINLACKNISERFIVIYRTCHIVIKAALRKKFTKSFESHLYLTCPHYLKLLEILRLCSIIS